MSELTKIFLTSGLTIVGGVILFVAGQIVVKFILEPMHGLKETLAGIQYAFIYHDQAIHTPISGDGDRSDKAAESFRKLASDVHSRACAIPFYRVVAALSFGFLPRKDNVRKAAIELRGLSNSVHQPDRSKNGDRVARICRLLGLDPLQ